MRLKFWCLAIALIPNLAMSWEIYKEKGDDGTVLTIAEQVGEGGAFLNLVCLDKKIHIEIIYPGAIEDTDDVVELVQVDGRPERLIAGYIEKIDSSTSVFVGLDRRGEPAAATPLLIKEMISGNELYLGDPDRTEAIERWSMRGSSAAIKAVRKSCS